MAFPVKPDEFKALIILPEDNLATAFIKLAVRLPILWYKNYRYMHNPDKTLTARFQQDICDMGCNQ